MGSSNFKNSDLFGCGLDFESLTHAGLRLWLVPTSSAQDKTTTVPPAYGAPSPPAAMPRTFLHAGRTALSTGVPAACAACAAIAAAPAQYSGLVRKLTTTPLFVLFRHLAQCMWRNLRVNPPSRSSALVHLHRFRGMR